MTLEEHKSEIERIIEENTKQLMAALATRNNDPEWSKLFIQSQFFKVSRELNDNDKKYINQ